MIGREKTRTVILKHLILFTLHSVHCSNLGNSVGEAECGKLCLDTPACAWFTYLKEQKYCLMFANCNSLTTYCKNCYSSPESCLEG